VGRSVTHTLSNKYQVSTVIERVCSRVCSEIAFFCEIYVTRNKISV
jgi:hypothetical protein